MKIVTICGSMKLKDEMMVIAQKYALKGYCILTPVYPVIKDHKITDEEMENLKKAHFKRIELSDEILVIDINGIGYSTSLEIEYAKKIGKKVIYYSKLKDDEKISIK